MAESYAELHLHTAYSLREGASLPEELVSRAADLGLPALAITDHDGLYGVLPFYTAARAAGIKPLIGAEVRVSLGRVSDAEGRVSGLGSRVSDAATDESRNGSLSCAHPSLDPQASWEHDATSQIKGPRPETRDPRPAHVTLLARDRLGYANLCRLLSRAHLDNEKDSP
ncbi:MAG: PHP domain-containing protein, partial [Dehalococcoidia bacterium]